MKIFTASLACLLVGLAIGSYVAHRYYQRHASNEVAQQMLEARESSDALLAATSLRAVVFIASGETQKAVEALSHPIASYYAHHRTQTLTNKQALALRATIDALASTNKIVEAQIAAAVIDR